MTSSLHRFSSAALAVAAILVLGACTSTPKIKGVPSRLPEIHLNGSANTPSHNMAHTDYPFDSNGNYVTAWVAEGGARAEPEETRRSTPRRTSATTPRRSTSSSGNSSKSKSTASKSSSGGSSRKHTVKSGDSLWSIARKYGTSVAKLKSANGLTSDNIRDGRALSIPR